MSFVPLAKGGIRWLPTAHPKADIHRGRYWVVSDATARRLTAGERPFMVDD